MLFYLLLCIFFFQYVSSFHNKMTFKTFLSQKKVENKKNAEILDLLYSIQKSGFHIHKLLSYSYTENLNTHYEKNNMNTGNVYQEKQKNLHILTNAIIRSNINALNVKNVLLKDTNETLLNINSDKKLIFVYEPLDNYDGFNSNMLRSTLFSCYCDHLDLENNLDSINSQHTLVLSGYILYTSSINLIFCYENQVYHFIYDEFINDYVCINDNVKMPKKGNIYCINEAKINQCHKKHDLYLKKLKNEGYTSIYSGCLVADIHTLINNGGIYMNPNINNQSKINVLYQAKPLAHIIECAGGLCVDEYRSIQFKKINSESETTPLYIGSKNNINDMTHFCYFIDKHQSE